MRKAKNETNETQKPVSHRCLICYIQSFVAWYKKGDSAFNQISRKNFVGTPLEKITNIHAFARSNKHLISLAIDPHRIIPDRLNNITR